MVHSTVTEVLFTKDKERTATHDFRDYMRLLFEEGSFNDDENYTNAAIAYLVKQGYKPMWKPKQIADYNFFHLLIDLQNISGNL